MRDEEEKIITAGNMFYNREKRERGKEGGKNV
jgi:hypothetical protein